MTKKQRAIEQHPNNEARWMECKGEMKAIVAMLMIDGHW